MKHFFLTILIALSGITLSLAQTGGSPAGSTNNTSASNTPASNSTPQTQVQNSPVAKPNPTTAPTTATVSGSKTIQDIISFLPVGFFLFITLTIFIKLRKDGVKLSNILIDKETIQEKSKHEAAIAESHAKVATAAATAINANPNVDLSSPMFASASSGSAAPAETPNPEQSTSRLIVFICGITSIALACCITSFYFYKSFTGSGDVSISGLSNVLYGLGLGVIPYGFNKIAAALK